jgi:hypothetical protein
MTSSDLARYRDLLGDDGVEEHAALALAGSEFGVTLRPGDGAALAAVLAQLGADGRCALVRGGGSRVESGNALRAADVLSWHHAAHNPQHGPQPPQPAIRSRGRCD